MHVYLWRYWSLKVPCHFLWWHQYYFYVAIPLTAKPISTRKCCIVCNFGLSHDLDCIHVQPTCSKIGVSVGGLSHCSGIWCLQSQGQGPFGPVLHGWASHFPFRAFWVISVHACMCTFHACVHILVVCSKGLGRLQLPLTRPAKSYCISRHRFLKKNTAIF